jgi:hypothetical protein
VFQDIRLIERYQELVQGRCVYAPAISRISVDQR